jgi:prevent-host-death family protein
VESLSLTDTRAQLPQLLDRVAAGETFTVTRHGTPVAVIVGQAEWMKTKTQDVIVQAQELRRRLDAASDISLDVSGEPTGSLDVDEWIADLRAGKGEYPDERGL